MTTIHQSPAVASRRRFLKSSGSAALATVLVTSGSAVLAPSQGWGLEVKALKPQTMASLIQMARDIYPHDQIADRYYAIAVKRHDETAAADKDHLHMIEDGITDLDARAGSTGYLGVGWEADRVALLEEIEPMPFFQAVRGGLVVDLYNQEELWPIFGYEGASFEMGGYIERGFDDIEWL
ncbi:MAG: gluconate 2-dehydrogenase subunit 3 family protein [Geminicoccaceae bacterium]